MENMTAIVFNNAYEMLGELDDYGSFIWTERYYTTGDFELVLPVNSKNVSLCQKGYYIARGDIPTTMVSGDGAEYTCYENMGVIECIEYDTDLAGVEIMRVSGQFVTGILGRRVATEWRGQDMYPQMVMYRLISENLSLSADEARRVPELNYATFDDDETGITSTIDVVFNGENVLDACSSLAEDSGFGFRLRVMPTFKPLYTQEGSYWGLYMYRGVDRSYGQSANPYVVFSDEYDNLMSSYYKEDVRGMVTDVLVNGEITDTGTRYTTWASNGTTNTGVNRHESFVESSQVRTLDDGTVLTDAQYIKNLQQEGRLSIRNLAQAFSGEVVFGQYVWREDVNIGDVVTIQNKRWGVYVNARIIEMIESTNEAGEYTTVPTFGI